MRVLVGLVALAATALASCATSYKPEGLGGGFRTLELRPDVVRVTFTGNGYTTKETAQTYWLYRCAELAIEKGYAGFEVLSDMQFVWRRPADGDIDATTPHSRMAVMGRVQPAESPAEFAEAAGLDRSRHGDAQAGLAGERIRIAHGGGVIFVPSGGGAIYAPRLEGDVHLINRPFEVLPPKVFDAKELEAVLEPHVKADKCDVGNVCPHVHEYLFPRGKLQPGPPRPAAYAPSEMPEEKK